VNYSAAIHEQKASNQVSLFGEAGDDLPEPRMMPRDDWEAAERLTEEFKAVGFYLSGHPLDDYMTPLKRKWGNDRGVPFLTLDELTEKVATRGAMNARLVGVVAGRQERKSARGNRFAFAQMSDPTGAYEVTLFSDTLEAARDHLETGSKVIVTVEATMEADQLKLLGRSVGPVDLAIGDVSALGLKVFVNAPDAIAAVRDVLEGARNAAKSAGRGPVQLCLMDPSLPGEVEVDLGIEYPVTPQIKGAIRSLEGVWEVEEL
jgi:DNA polymerase-3 subunit alpha